MNALDLRGLVSAPVTPFTRDGEVDHPAIQRLGSWLGSFKGVKGLVVLGHAGEGTFLTADEQTAVIESFIKSVKGKIPVIAGITLEGTKVAALEAKRAVKAGAAAGLLYPSHGWLRFGYQKGAPQDRYRVIYEESGMPLILSNVQSRDPARDRSAAGCLRHEERCAQHAQVGHRDSDHPSRASRSADSYLP